MFARSCVSRLLVVVVVAVSWRVGMTQDESRSRILVKGRCPVVVLADGFDKEQMGGVWYRMGGTPNFEEHSVNCTTYNYVSTDTGYKVSSNGIGRNGSAINHTIAITQLVQNTARFNTTIRDIEAEMVVINTDYSTYSCLFSCYNFQESHKVHFGWILSRTSTLPKEKVATCSQELLKVGIPLTTLRGTYQGQECGLQ